MGEMIFDPARGTMRVVAFASGSGTNFREAVLESRLPGSNFSIDLLVTDKETKKGETIGAIRYAKEYGIAHRTLPGLEWCGSWKTAQQTIEGRVAYEQKSQVYNHELLRLVAGFEEEKGFVFDLALLAGYMRLFKGALQRRFTNRAINVHPAYLGKLNPDGSRTYIGENAVFDALHAGETMTRSSIILVDPETDAGAILVTGPSIAYAGDRPITQNEAGKHQNFQKESSDWPSLRFALRAISHGEFALHQDKFHPDGNPFVLYQGKEMPYQGYELQKE